MDYVPVMDLDWSPVELGFADLLDYPEEQMGSKKKAWVSLPGDQRPWLVKLARVNGEDGFVSGEDWAEWIVARLAGEMGVPCADVRPALFLGGRAIVSRSVIADRRERLVHGNELLSARFLDYDPSVVGENPGYTVARVRDALQGVDAVPGTDFSQSLTAFDMWAGYLLMDAWVAGRDRHHENWGLIRSGDKGNLAPSFDHGNALGFAERDPSRQRMLADDAHRRRWRDRGRSRQFAGRPSLASAANEALRLASPAAAAHWRCRLDAVAAGSVRNIVEAVPQDLLSEVGRTFVLTVLDENRRELLDGHRAP